MAVLPHTSLFFPTKEGPDNMTVTVAVVISGAHIQLVRVNDITGNVTIRHAHAASIDSNRSATADANAKTGPMVNVGLINLPPIRCASVDVTGRHLLTAGDDKILRVWKIDADVDADGRLELMLVNQRDLPKRPTAAQFTRDGETILVADKFGDVFSYPRVYVSEQDLPSSLQPNQLQHLTLPLLHRGLHDSSSGERLVLGHTSQVTALSLTSDGRHIITADRDEHIRISCFPQGYSIEAYCLGHNRVYIAPFLNFFLITLLSYVSAVKIPQFAPSVLISGGGDPGLKFWNWAEGKIVGDVRVWDAVEPFIAVPVPGGRRGFVHGIERMKGEGSGFKRGSGLRSKDRARERKRGRKEDNVKEDGGTKMQLCSEARSPVRPDYEMDIENGVNSDYDGDKEEKVLVIHRIDTICSFSGVQHVVFNAIGATALFTLLFTGTSVKDDEGNTVNPDTGVRMFDFGMPVIDFSIQNENPKSGTMNINIWVLLDGNFCSKSKASLRDGDVLVTELPSPPQSHFVKVLRLSDSGEPIYLQPDKLIELADSTLSVPFAIVTSTKHDMSYARLAPRSTFRATSEDIQKLELYEDLLTLSKSSSSMSSTVEEKIPNKNEPSLTKRKIGRMKKKQAVKEILEWMNAGTG